MHAIAEEAELRLKVIKGKLHRAEDVEFLMTQRDTAIKAQFLAIPSRVARLLVGKTDFQEIFELLTNELHAVLENLSAYDPLAFTEQNEEYLASLFPAPELAKTGGNGENESETDELVDE